MSPGYDVDECGPAAVASCVWKASVMPDSIDPVELARKIADIASRTTDPSTARQLVDLTDWLLTDVGLPRIGSESSRQPRGPPRGH